MGFKMGAIIGFGVGYYLGAQAGRERYEQINQWFEQVRSSDPVSTATDRVRELVDDAELAGSSGNGPGSGGASSN